MNCTVYMSVILLKLHIWFKQSIYAVRAKRCHEILHDEKIVEADLVKLVSDYTLLTDLLIELTNKQVGDVSDNI